MHGSTVPGPIGFFLFLFLPMVLVGLHDGMAQSVVEQASIYSGAILKWLMLSPRAHL